MQPESRCIDLLILKDLFLGLQRFLIGGPVGAEGGIAGSGNVGRGLGSVLEVGASVQLLPLKNAPVIPASRLDPPHISVQPWRCAYCGPPGRDHSGVC